MYFPFDLHSKKGPNNIHQYFRHLLGITPGVVQATFLNESVTKDHP